MIFWRDVNTKKSIVTYDTEEKLFNEKPAQCLRLEEDDVREIQNMVEGGPGAGTTIIPSFSAEGIKSIAKQLNGAIRYGMTINGSSKSSDVSWREKLRTFFYMADVEPEFHKFGIFGFYHPDLTDFNLDPDDTEGYTISMPHDAFVGNSPTNEINWKFILDWGGVDRK